jgi:hypothetical protein
MTIRRAYWVLALPLTLALATSPAAAGQAKTLAKPADKPAQLKVDSPNMATSISDWHAELGKAPARTASAQSGRTATQIATNTAPSDQRGNRGKNSARPTQRAQEVPIRSLRP